mmetsp:Transcript_15262/g.50128  ORF Transcript_15262/g.50128 Transcript_15262/m.50128 type:complete len:233 (-) Transcript_15262:315-1013(-)
MPSPSGSASLMSERIWRRERPRRSFERAPRTLFTSFCLSFPAPSVSAASNSWSKSCVSPSLDCKASSAITSSVKRSTRMLKQSGTNSLYEILPSPSRSHSERRRLMSFLVRPRSALMRQRLNSARESVPFPSSSAFSNTLPIIASSSSRGMPCSNTFSTSARAASSASSRAIAASSFAFKLCTIITITGRNSRYSRTPSSFSSASDMMRRMSFFDRPISADCRHFLNSERSR